MVSLIVCEMCRITRPLTRDPTLSTLVRKPICPLQDIAEMDLRVAREIFRDGLRGDIAHREPLFDKRGFIELE